MDQSMEHKHPLKFIDIGANLLDPMFRGMYHGNDSQSHPEDIDAVLQRAWDANLDKIIITAGNLEESKAALALARSDDRLFSTVGVHPTRCSEFNNNPEEYMKALRDVIEDGQQDNKIVAIGELGLDYDRLHFCDLQTQKTYFEAQLASLARTYNLPLFLHLRGSDSTESQACSDFLDIIERHIDAFPGGVVHSFDGSLEEAQRILAIQKLDIGINGCSLKTDNNIQVAAAIPIDRLHYETDCPWCEIRNSHAGAGAVQTKMQSKDKKKHDPGCLVKGRNEPCNIRQVHEVIAHAKKIRDPSVLAQTVYKNSQRMFFSLSRLLK